MQFTQREKGVLSVFQIVVRGRIFFVERKKEKKFHFFAPEDFHRNFPPLLFLSLSFSCLSVSDFCEEMHRITVHSFYLREFRISQLSFRSLTDTYSVSC